MPSLARDLRRDLENKVKDARRIAEAGARKALDGLGVGDAAAPPHLGDGQRALRNRLRAHGRQVGDTREAGGRQSIERLMTEVAYEHWHRMLFARFLAENDLLIEPDSGLALSLEDVRDIAREQKADWLDLAATHAQRMLPEIFRVGDPALAVALPPETRSELEDRLKALAPEIFRADDSLGWVYQFWQADKKDAVNKSGVKIGADELPAVTQLFTEDYMVLFLLHNTLGAWWAGKRLAADPALANGAADEAELRAACAVEGVEWTYLRFVRDTDARDGADGTPGPWRPAAGSFAGWPAAARDITLLDPCMGSGHFLVFALPILTALRQTEEGLDRPAAVAAVLRDNLHGLEIDPRCTQIAAFNLAFAAWRLLGRHVGLPVLNLACSGLAIGVSKAEWLRLGEKAAALADPDARRDLLETEATLLNAGVDARIRTGLERMYDLFAKAPWLGSLIDPRRAGADLFAADFDALAPFLKKALADGGDEVAEMAVSAQGLAKAAELLGRTYVLVATNVPYLTRNKFDLTLRVHCDEFYKSSQGDIATVFIERLLRTNEEGGNVAVVFPQNCFFLGTYDKFRLKLLSQTTFNFIAALGEEAWEAFGKRGPLATLASFTHQKPGSDTKHFAIDATVIEDLDKKRELLETGAFSLIPQSDQRQNPDQRILFESLKRGDLLGTLARAIQGISPADHPKFARFFWEIARPEAPWRFWQGSVNDNVAFGGREQILWFGESLQTEVEEGRAYVRSDAAWGRRGIVISQMRRICATLSSGEATDTNVSVMLCDEKNLPAVWCYCTSDQYMVDLRSIDRQVKITNSTLTKVPFDLPHWQKVAAEKYPDGLPKPHSDDPTQWLFNGHPVGSDDPLQVAVARLVGYRWPRQTGSAFMDCPALSEPDGLEHHADADGIVCLSPIKGEAAASERLAALLSDAFAADWIPARLAALLASAPGGGAASLDDYLRDRFFARHVELFQNRPFVWHLWDGRRDGFHALVNYHRLAGPDGEGRRSLEKLVYTYLREWIDHQRRDAARGTEGAEGRLAAAEHLHKRLEAILTGEPPHDLFVRWKPLHRQPIGWDPDVNDGVRMNIRPFLTARPLEARRADACILRVTPRVKWDKDRGTEPARDKADYPWFWGWDGRAQDFPGGDRFDGNRWNDLHYTTAAKRAARDAKGGA